MARALCLQKGSTPPSLHSMPPKVFSTSIYFQQKGKWMLTQYQESRSTDEDAGPPRRADALALDHALGTAPVVYLYSDVITDTSVLTPYIANTDYLYIEP